MAKDAFYTDPKYQRVKPKIAVVISVYIPEQRVKNYGHFKEDKLETLELNLSAHAHFKAGVDYDLILVNHGGAERYLEHLQKIKPFIVTDEPNFGFSFGAWKQAWQAFGDEYDFYLFTEDDIAPSKDGWLAEIVMRFLSDKKIGAVGNFVELRSMHENQSNIAWELLNYKREMMYNFDGAFTFTSSKILKQVEEIGGLPVFDCAPNTDLPGTINEMVFQQPILELGYTIDSFADDEHFLVHGSEIVTNHLMHKTGPFAPLLNLNGRHAVPEIAELYKILKKDNG